MINTDFEVGSLDAAYAEDPAYAENPGHSEKPGEPGKLGELDKSDRLDKRGEPDRSDGSDKHKLDRSGKPGEALSSLELQQMVSRSHPARYLVTGMFFGIVLVKSQVVSWWRIQEMFRLQSFHMYGVIGSAVAVGAISIFLIKKFKIKTLGGESIHFYPRAYNKGQVFGGLLFGLGWAVTGACPGPLFALIGAGYCVVLVTLLGAIIGTWVYGWLREKLPH